ncbi:LPS assembly lipoprotein LptE [Caulobacter sp. UNC279MFTsu5.1]|uniref:LPS assembly lipoprotein LptE n=1 Tax=Caulobacter sp. UNC279MFTsu5.1 TaxID=1502775 RepID=UPI0008E186F8|nr:LPS assembly lipoprotein LptE [Caulobacter sp. UNC279MFTsu5.1]SFK38114.1 LPS-assembly lipoprotein [Caulobacter sp. UNC279MFTsu5.1]
MKRFPLSKTLPAAVLAVAALALSACGFTPLYGSQSVTKGLSTIEVVAADGRAGYLLREKLDDAFARDVNLLPSHRLVYTIEERRYARGVRVDNVANRYELNLTAKWRLLDAKTGQEVRAGTTSAAVTYDSADQPYASIAAQQDSQERAANELARRIQLDLAAWLAGKAKA